MKLLIKFSFLMMLLVYSLSSFSNEAAAPAAEGHGGGGGEGAGAKAEKPRVNLNEWREVESKLSGLRSKISAQNGVVQNLIAEKNHIKDENKSAKVSSELTKEHKKLVTLINEYEEQRNLLKYRYPEKGLSKQREYERIEVKNLEEMENQMTIDGKMKKVMKKIRDQYPSDASKINSSENQKNKVDPSRIQKKKENELPVQKSNLTEPIIFVK